MSSFSRNVPVLAVGQALLMSGTSLMVTSAALVGLMLATDKSLSTLPLAMQFVATMLTTIPAALLLARFGRRRVFMLSTLIGMMGAAWAAYSIFTHQFWLFVMSTAMIGVFNGFGVYFRFAAADSVSKALKSRAVSYVLVGGIAAAVIGPNLAKYTRDVVPDAVFAGSYLALIGVYVMAFFVLSLLRLPKLEVLHERVLPRALRTIVMQPRFIVALLCGMLGYGVMSFLMTATPLAMLHHEHDFGDTAFVIQWHILGMFVPSLVTGHLIRYLGVLPVMMVGAALGLGCVLINLSGTQLWHFWTALLLLGVSWNFLFVGATTLLTETYHQSERTKAQAINDFSVFSTVAIASLVAGSVQHELGWRMVNLGTIPAFLMIIVAIAWLANRKPPKLAAI